jgi:hypothetical protein
MTYGTPTNAEQVVMLATALMGAVTRLETPKEVNHKAWHYSHAMNATSSAAADYSFGLGLWEKCRIAILACRWAAEVTDGIEGAQADAAFEIYDNAVDLGTIASRIWGDECNYATPVAVTKVQKELFGNA